MISITDVTVSFSGNDILDTVNFHISKGEKIGLCGRNGAGKSTLMKLIAGLQKPTSGRIEITPGKRIGYLPQIMEHNRGVSVLEETMSVFSHIDDMEAEIDRISTALSERTDYESDSYAALIEELNEYNDRVAMEKSGESPEVRARRTLYGLGFREDEVLRNTETFSQGWNMRMELAKILLSAPDLLLLDEPTNHLDIESIEWLESYLKSYPGAMLLVSHDRKFIDNTTSRTIEIMLGKINDYKVPYSQYLELRAERLQQQRAAYDNQQRMIEKTEDFINRFRYKPTKSNQVQSRIKALKSLDIIELDDVDTSQINVRFPSAPRSSEIVFKAEGLTAAYPQKTVFSGANIELRRGDKIALVGRNGEGKTTLMRILMSELEPAAGEIRRGTNVSVGYYAQNQEDVLDKNETVFSTLDRIAVGDIRTKLRDILAAFLFRGEDIDKKVAVLSGGERARLAMAKLMLQPYNLLALDEPTNHMDIQSKDVLKKALQQYDGTLLVVSHDRDFLSSLVDKVYEFRDGKVKEYLGGVEDYLEVKHLDSLHELERDMSQRQRQSGDKAQKDYETKKREEREMKQIQKKIEKIEAQIQEMEKKRKEIEDILVNPDENTDILTLSTQYQEYGYKIEAAEKEWEEAYASLG